MVITDDRHNNLRLYRRDRLVTGRHVEGDLAEVAVRVHKVGRAQRHVRRAFLGTGRRRYRRILRRLREVRRSVQLVADVRDLVARDRMRLAVVFVCMVITDDRHNNLRLYRRDRQLAGGEGGLIIIGRNVLTVLCDRVGIGKGTIIVRTNIGALGGGIGDRQNIALAQALDGVVIGGDRFAGAGNGSHKGTAFLLGAVVDLPDVVDRDRQRAFGDRQGAEVLGDNVVTCRAILGPVCRVGIGGGTHLRLAAIRGDDDFALILCNQAGDAAHSVRQRRAIVGLFRAASGDSCLRRQNLQPAGTNIQVDTVVFVHRQIAHAKAKRVFLPVIIIRIQDILFIVDIIASAGSGSAMNQRISDQLFPDSLAICGKISVVTDHDIGVIIVCIRSF